METNNTATDLAATLTNLRASMTSAYENGQESLAMIIFQEIVATNVRIRRLTESREITFTKDADVSAIVRANAAKKGA